MKTKTQILIVTLFVSTLHPYAQAVVASRHSTSNTSVKEKQTLHVSTSSPDTSRSGATSNWENVTTPPLSGENHENHRGSAWCDFDNDGFIDFLLRNYLSISFLSFLRVPKTRSL